MSMLSRVRASGLLWDVKELSDQQTDALVKLMTPANLQRWGSRTATMGELVRKGYTFAVVVRKVLKGRFGPRGRKGKQRKPN